MVDGPRVGDAERERANTQLLDAVGTGVIDLAEYEERSGQVWRSRTRSELEAVLADLPSQQPGTPAAGSPGPDTLGPGAPPVPIRPQAGTVQRRRRVVAVMSQDRFAGPVRPSDAVDAYAVLGSAVVDLRREDLPDGLHVTVTAVLGGVEVLVPSNAQVHLSGMSIMGNRSVDGIVGGGPEVYVRGIAVMGSVTVSPGATQAAFPAREDGGAPQMSVAVRRESSGARVGRLVRRVSAGAGVLLVAAGVVGGLVVAGPDGVSIFGSRDVTVQRDQTSVAVSVLFGSVEVVVPNGARVDTSGVTVFGSVACKAACSPGNTGPVVDVRSIGGFGSVNIKTQTEADRGQSDN